MRPDVDATGMPGSKTWHARSTSRPSGYIAFASQFASTVATAHVSSTKSLLHTICAAGTATVLVLEDGTIHVVGPEKKIVIKKMTLNRHQ